MTKTTLYHTPNGALAVHQSAGDGPPIVLVHGNSSSSRAFSRQLEGSLGRRRRIVAIDLLGHGRSENASDPAAYLLPGHALALGGDRRQFRPRPGFVRRLEPWRPHPARGGERSAAGARLRHFRRAAGRVPAGDGGCVPAQPGDGGGLLGRGDARAGGSLCRVVLRPRFRRHSRLLRRRRAARRRPRAGAGRRFDGAGRLARRSPGRRRPEAAAGGAAWLQGAVASTAPISPS